MAKDERAVALIKKIEDLIEAEAPELVYAMFIYDDEGGYSTNNFCCSMHMSMNVQQLILSELRTMAGKSRETEH